MKPHVRGVLLEGLSHAGKTSVLTSLKRVQANDDNFERSTLVLGEHYSQQLQNINGELTSLTSSEHLDLLEDRVGCIEKLNDWAVYLGPAHRRSRGLFFILERFHLNHRFAYGGSVNIAKIEERLFNLGGACFLLTVSPGYIRERILHRGIDRRDKRTIDQVCDDWINAQERIVALTQESKLPTTIIETDGRNWDEYAAKIMSFMED